MSFLTSSCSNNNNSNSNLDRLMAAVAAEQGPFDAAQIEVQNDQDLQVLATISAAAATEQKKCAFQLDGQPCKLCGEGEDDYVDDIIKNGVINSKHEHVEETSCCTKNAKTPSSCEQKETTCVIDGEPKQQQNCCAANTTSTACGSTNDCSTPAALTCNNTCDPPMIDPPLQPPPQPRDSCSSAGTTARTTTTTSTVAAPTTPPPRLKTPAITVTTSQKEKDPYERKKQKAKQSRAQLNTALEQLAQAMECATQEGHQRMAKFSGNLNLMSVPKPYNPHEKKHKKCHAKSITDRPQFIQAATSVLVTVNQHCQALENEIWRLRAQLELQQLQQQQQRPCEYHPQQQQPLPCTNCSNESSCCNKRKTPSCTSHPAPPPVDQPQPTSKKPCCR